MNKVLAEVQCVAQGEFEGGNVIVQLYGKPYSWRTKKEGNRPNMKTLHRAVDIVRAYGISTLCIPNPREFNAEIVTPEHCIPLFDNLADDKSVLVRGGIYADGILLQEKEAMMIASGDCPTLVIMACDTVIAAHCGRESLLKGMRYGKDVVTNAVEMLIEHTQCNVEEISTYLTGGINAEHFDHSPKAPKYGNRNREMIDFIIDTWGPECVKYPKTRGCINLNGIVERQLELLGIPPVNMTHDSIDTFTSPLLWSHRRGDLQRNGVIVMVR